MVPLMQDSLKISRRFPVTPRALYEAWLDSAAHSAFTGSPAVIAAAVGGAYSAWDGYIEGVTLELEPYRRIVQSWRTGDFPDDAPDSRLEVLFEEAPGGTKLTLIHTGIPRGQAARYRQGWRDYYFTPMEDYFA